jgi:hypothetical protein
MFRQFVLGDECYVSNLACNLFIIAICRVIGIQFLVWF